MCNDGRGGAIDSCASLLGVPEQDDRARAVHRLSEIVTVVLFNLPALREAIERGDTPAALRIVAELRAATYESVSAFAVLRGFY